MSLRRDETDGGRSPRGETVRGSLAPAAGLRDVALISPLDSYSSYGIRLVSSYLKRHGIRTKIIFLANYTEMWQIVFHQSYATYRPPVLEQIADIVKESELIGITMMTMDRPRVQSLCDHLKRLQKPIMIGGIHPTIFPEDAIGLTGLINIGEGLESLVEYCGDPGRRDIRNIWSRDPDGVVVKNAIRPSAGDIDQLPFPDYDFTDHYVLSGTRVVKVDQAMQERFLGRTYHQFASLGCPFSCTYCINNVYKKLGQGYDAFKFHGTDYIIREARAGASLSPRIEHINFTDDGFIAMSEKAIASFSEAYRKEIGLPFSVTGVNPTFVTRRKLELLVAAGLKRTRVGLQSAYPEALSMYKRPANLRKFTEVNDLLHSHPSLVFPYFDVIVDNPFVDREADLLATIEFLLNLEGRFTLILYSLRLYPGTELFDRGKTRALPERYYEASYAEHDKLLLTYIITVIQCTQSRRLARWLLKIYRSRGNIRIPAVLFAINTLVYLARCGIEHVRKRDRSVLPQVVVRFMRRRRGAGRIPAARR